MKVNVFNRESLFYLGIFIGLIPITNIFTIILINITSSEPTTSINFAHSIILGFVTSCMFPAVMEELLFRGILQTLLLRFGVFISIITTTLLFAILHIGNPVGIPAIIILSTALSIAMFLFRKIIYVILLHFINNCFAYSIFLLNYYYSQNTAFILTITLYILFAIFSAVILIIGRKKCLTGIKLLWKKRLSMLEKR